MKLGESERTVLAVLSIEKGVMPIEELVDFPPVIKPLRYCLSLLSWWKEGICLKKPATPLLRLESQL